MAAIDDLLRAYGLAGQINPIRSGLPGTINPVRSGLPGQINPGQTGLPGTPNPPPSSTMPLPIQPQPMPGSPPPLTGSPNPVRRGTGENPYVNPGVVGGGRNLYDTGWSKKIGELNPLSEWTRWTAQSGFGGNNRKGQFGRNQFSNFDAARNAALLERPGESLRDFATRTDPMAALQREWLGASASARGLNPASRSSVIRWG